MIEGLDWNPILGREVFGWKGLSLRTRLGTQCGRGLEIRALGRMVFQSSFSNIMGCCERFTEFHAYGVLCKSINLKYITLVSKKSV